MKKPIIDVSLFFSLFLILFIACSDDPPTIIQEDSKDFLIIGAVSMRPYLEIMGDIWSINGKEPNLDSIIFADSSCTIYKGMAHVEGNNYHYGFYYQNKADSFRFVSGDVATLNMFRGNETASTDIVMLTMPEDSMKVISYPDSVGLNNNITVTWNKVANADWYSVEYFYTYDISINDRESDIFYEYTTDTTFTIPAIHAHNGRITFFFRAITGPTPNEPGNIESNAISGVLYSFASSWMPQGYGITVGSGLLVDSSFKLSVEIIEPTNSTDWLKKLYLKKLN